MLVLDLGIEFELNNTELVEVDEGVFEVQSNALSERLENELCNNILNLHLILNSPPALVVQECVEQDMEPYDDGFRVFLLQS